MDVGFTPNDVLFIQNEQGGKHFKPESVDAQGRTVYRKTETMQRETVHAVGKGKVKQRRVRKGKKLEVVAENERTPTGIKYAAYWIVGERVCEPIMGLYTGLERER